MSNFLNNRPIKFKVWDTQLRKFRDGDLTVIEAWLDSDSWDDPEEMWNDPYHWQSVPTYNGRMIWLEYTGKKDREENEIYDGDILQRSDGVEMVVLWNEDMAGWYLYLGQPYFEHGIMEQFAPMNAIDAFKYLPEGYGYKLNGNIYERDCFISEY
jgi:hypothetical protein